MSFVNLVWDRNHLEFDIINIDISIINSLRRVILSEIENVAFEFSPTGTENINILVNTSPLHNEFLSHRLSMIPICLTADDIIDFDSNDYIFSLKKKNITNEIINVTTEDIQITDKNGKILNHTEKEQIFPKNHITKDYILLNKLKTNLFEINNGDEINITMKAIKNIAKNHSSFCPVSICSFYNIIDNDKANKVFSEKLQENPTINKQTFNNLEKQKYFYTNEYNEPNQIKFILESECLLTPEYLFIKGFIVLMDKLNKLKLKITNNDYQYNYINKSDIYEIIIKNEDHTIGNLIQAQFYNKFIREQNKNLLKFIGYNIVHPLDSSLIFKLQFSKNMESNLKNFIIEGIDLIQIDLKNLANEWYYISKLNLQKNYAKDIDKIL
jgi:DNA-directed RNA polymerase II subunit RPB3